MKDFYGKEIKSGDLVVYGKADRNRPLMVGYILSVNEEDGHWGTVTVQGIKNSKPGTISGFQIEQRIVVLPDEYKERR